MLISEAMDVAGVQETDVVNLHRVAGNWEGSNVSRYVFVVRDGRYSTSVELTCDTGTVHRKRFDFITDADAHARALCGW